MTALYGQLAGFARQLLATSALRVGVVVAAMIAVALSEGLGLLMLVPLLGLIGLGGSQADGPLGQFSERMAGLFGVELSLGYVLAVFVVLVALRQAMFFVSMQLAERTRIDVVNGLRRQLFAAVGRADWRSLKGSRFKQYGQALLVDCWRSGDAALNLFRAVSAVFVIAANLAVAWIVAPLPAMLILLAMLLLAAVFGSRLGAIRSQGGQLTGIQDEIYAVVDNYLDNLRVAKQARAEQLILDRFTGTLERLAGRMRAFHGEVTGARVGMQLLVAIALALFVYLGSTRLGIGGTALLLTVFITARLIPHMTLLNQSLHHLAYHLPAYEQAQAAIDHCAANRESAVAVPVDAPVSIGLRNVSVTAPDEPGRLLIADISFVLRQGETIAIEGPSGAGKSTLADVLSGLLSPDAGGELLLDGTAQSDSQRIAWRQRVGYVPQASALLRDSVRNNLLWPLAEKPSGDRVERVLQCVGLLPLLDRLPQGLDTLLDQREGQLSGGERQRIALARELLRSPDLLILDEASNELDIAAERELIASVRRDHPALTLVLIAHRQETARLADRRIELRDGRLADPGAAAVSAVADSGAGEEWVQSHA